LADNQNKTQPDFWSYILRRKDERAISKAKIESNTALILPTGTETISTILSGALYLLSKNPLVLAKLRHEIQGNFGTENDITIASVTKLPYLHTILNEALRIYPPFAGGLKRRAASSEHTVSSYVVPQEVGLAQKIDSLF